MAQPHLAEQPVFDPHNVGPSLDVVQTSMPIRPAILAGTVVGEFLSRRRGHGFERDGVRGYEIGDDPRHIDHRVTARQVDGSLMVRERYKDVTPALYIVTDMLQSRNAFSPGYPEQLLGASMVLAYMRLAQLANIPSAVIASNDEGLAVVQRQPVQGRPHLIKTAGRLADQLLAQEGKEEDVSYYLADMLRYAGQRCSESIVAIVSDFRDVDRPDAPDHGWQTALQGLAKRRNQIISTVLINVDDFVIPDTVNRVKINKNLSRWIKPKDRKEYYEGAPKRFEAIGEALDGVKAHQIVVSTDDPRWIDTFKAQLKPGRRTKA